MHINGAILVVSLDAIACALELRDFKSRLFKRMWSIQSMKRVPVSVCSRPANAAASGHAERKSPASPRTKPNAAGWGDHWNDSKGLRDFVSVIKIIIPSGPYPVSTRALWQLMEVVRCFLEGTGALCVFYRL